MTEMQVTYETWVIEEGAENDKILNQSNSRSKRTLKYGYQSGIKTDCCSTPTSGSILVNSPDVVTCEPVLKLSCIDDFNMTLTSLQANGTTYKSQIDSDIKQNTLRQDFIRNFTPIKGDITNMGSENSTQLTSQYKNSLSRKRMLPKTYANGELVQQSDEHVYSTTSITNGQHEVCSTGVGNGDFSCERDTGKTVNTEVPLRMDKRLQKLQETKNKRDSFEVLEEWVSLTNGSSENFELENGHLPSHIEDALSSSFRSARIVSDSLHCDKDTSINNDSSGIEDVHCSSVSKSHSVPVSKLNGNAYYLQHSSSNYNENTASISHDCAEAVPFQNHTTDVNTANGDDSAKNTDKSLLQKLRDSGGNSTESTNTQLESKEPDRPLKRMDSFELLEEWCNLSLPPDSLDNFENILNEVPPEKVESISDILKELNHDKKNQSSDSVDFLCADSSKVLVSTPIRSVSKEVSRDKLLDLENCDIVNTSPVTSLKTPRGGSCDVVIQQTLPCTDCVALPQTESRIIEQYVPSSDYVVSPQTENPTPETSLSADVSLILEQLVGDAIHMSNRRTERLRLKILKLDLNEISVDQTSSQQFIFQERNFIQSPTTVSEFDSFYNSEIQTGNIKSQDNTDSILKGSVAKFVNVGRNSLSPVDRKVFKEPYFCPSPLQLATPADTPSPSPRPRSPASNASSPIYRSGQSSPALDLQGARNGAMSPLLSPRVCDDGSSRSSSPHVLRSPNSIGSTDNLSLDSGALSIASSELEHCIGNSVPMSQNDSASNTCLLRSQHLDSHVQNSPSVTTKSEQSTVYSRAKDDLEVVTPRRPQVTYDMNGRRVVTPSPGVASRGTNDKITPMRLFSATCTTNGSTAALTSPSVRLFRSGTLSPKVYRTGTPRYCAPRRALSKSVSMPNFDAFHSDSMDTDAVLAAEEVLTKKRQQMADLKEERSKLNDRLAKQRLVQKSSLQCGERARDRSPFTSAQLYSGPNAIKLSGVELEAVTRLNTLCNGQQVARFITKPTADMIAHVQEEREALRVSWCDALTSVIQAHVTRTVEPSHVTTSILRSREAGIEFPYKNEPSTPIVLRRAIKSTKSKTLAEIDPTKI